MKIIFNFFQLNLQTLPAMKIVPGTECIAQYFRDQLWYRAVVESVGDFEASVRFIDYGNVQVVSFSKIQEIKPEFTEMPAQAIHCQLFGGKTSYTPNEIDSLYDQIARKNLELQFVDRKNGRYQVLIQEIMDDWMVSDYINYGFVASGVDLISARNAICINSIDLTTSNGWIYATSTYDYGDLEEQSTDNPETFTPSPIREIFPENVSIGSIHTGTVVYYQNPSSFIIHVDKNGLEALQHMIQTAYEQNYEVINDITILLI